MAQNFTTDVTQWQGVDKEPIPLSENLITSDGVYAQTNLFELLESPVNVREGRMADLNSIVTDENHQISIYDISGYIGSKVKITGYLDAYNVICVKQHYNNATSNGTKLYHSITAGSINLFLDLTNENYKYLWVSELINNPLTKSGILPVNNQVRNLINSTSQLEKTKLDKQPTANLINPDTLIAGKYIDTSGNILTASDNSYLVTPMLPVNESNIISNCSTASYARGYVVYDIYKNKLRVGDSGSQQYTYQNGDGFIIFGFRSSVTACANYGTILVEVPYSDYAPIVEIENNISEIENDISTLETKTENLESRVTQVEDDLNIKEVLSNPVNTRTGERMDTATHYVVDSEYGSRIFDIADYVGKYIKVTGHLKAKTSVICVKSDKNNVSSAGSVIYTNSTEHDIDITFQVGSTYRYLWLCGLISSPLVATVYTHIDDTIEELDNRIDKLEEENPEKADIPIIYPKAVYCQYNDVSPNYSLSIYADHCVKLSSKTKVLFENGNLDRLTSFYGNLSPDELTKNDGANKSETDVVGVIGGGIKSKSFTCKKRSILNSYTANTGIRILCIGDSVTNGTGSSYPRNITGEDNPTAYWSYMAKMCIIDKANNNGNGFDFVSIGRNNNTKRTIKVNNQYYKIWAEGRGSWTVRNYLYTLNGPLGYVNYFYDADKIWTDQDLNTAGVKFSLQSYLDKYKTLADDGKTRLVVGSTAGSEVTDVNAWDVCTPNVVYIQLGTNDDKEQYKTDIILLIKAIREEFPLMPIIISIIDEAGTYNTELYPEIEAKGATMYDGYLHSKMYELIQYVYGLEEDYEGVYCCPNYFIQPTGMAVSTRPVPLADALSGINANFGVETGQSPNLHPCTFAHANWAYHILSMVKWILN